MSKVEEAVSAVIRQYLQTALTSSYRNLPQLFSGASWTDLKPAMKRSRFDKKGIVHVRTIQKRRKLTKTSLKAEASTGAHDMKEENVLDEIKLAESPKLSKKQQTATNSFVKEMALLSFIYVVNFWN